MTIRNLEHCLRPRSVAVIGASSDLGSVGNTLTQNILTGGFQGPVTLVNPHHTSIGDHRCFKSIEALPEAPELAVIATPPDTVPGIIEALGKKGTRGAVVITAGFSPALKQAILDAAQPYCLRIIGPNCLGISVAALGLNANFGLNVPKPGSLALLSQSGALMTGILDWAAARDVGFSYVVSMGDMTDVDVGDLLDFLAADVSTSAILLYLETIPAARKFMSAARSAARAKPVIVIKSGRNAAAARAAATHTGALAGTDAAVSAAFRRAGLVRVEELEELFAAAETLASVKPVAGNRLLILTNGVGEEAAHGGRQKFRAAEIPTYESPNDAIKGFFYLWQHTKAQESLMRTPPKDTGHTTIADDAARAIMRQAVRAGRSLLTEPESKAVLSAFGIPTVATRVAGTPEEVAEIAHALLTTTSSVAVKILSNDISHKSDVGGVRLGLRTPEEARNAAERMLSRTKELRPEARLQGFTVQPMMVRKQAHELLMGVYEDPLFGPMILFGAGGTATEIIHDTAVALPPLDTTLALDLMAQTRICKLLEGYRDRPPADLAGIASALVRLSQLVVDCPAVKELDINPLLADETGVIALDARIRIDPKEVEKDGPNPRLAIRPYPNQWERWTETLDGERMLIRPIKPADEHLYGAFLGKLSPDDIRFRFLAPRKEFSHKFIARFTQIDYSRAMAFVALNKDETELYGVARLAADPDYLSGEYAIIVRSDLKGAGIGWILMRHLIHYAEREGLKDLSGDVLEHNTRMLDMCRQLGFEITADPEDVSIRKVRLKLPAPIQDAA